MFGTAGRSRREALPKELAQPLVSKTSTSSNWATAVQILDNQDFELTSGTPGGI